MSFSLVKPCYGFEQSLFIFCACSYWKVAVWAGAHGMDISKVVGELAIGGASPHRSTKGVRICSGLYAKTLQLNNDN